MQDSQNYEGQALPVTHKDYGENNSDQQQTVGTKLTNQAMGDVGDKAEVKSPDHVTVTIDEKTEKYQDEKKKGRGARIQPPSQNNTFALNEHERNNDKNPNREGTNTFPILVRRIDSYEILPKPFRSFNQLICCAYLSSFCCIMIGPFAAKRAMHAKIQRDKQLYSAAKNKALSAWHWTLFALLFGGFLILLALALVFGLN